MTRKIPHSGQLIAMSNRSDDVMDIWLVLLATRSGTKLLMAVDSRTR
ncbi:MAG: hypothetical protein OXC53_00525 [Rhodobacteraceae bacterium]|nr:hypothetical protein [Paracoccaceae bacterium]